MDKTAERAKYSINKDGEPIVEFKPVSEEVYIRSTDLCGLVSDVFHAAFADYYGCIFETSGNEPTFSLFFDHQDHSDSELPCACKPAADNTEADNVLARSRARDNYMKDGDRYFITDDGKDVIENLLMPRLTQGKINWKNIVGEYADQSNVNMFMRGPVSQYTKVSGIDARKICKLLFGTKDEKDTYDYGFRIMGPASFSGYQMPGQPQQVYMISVTRAHSKEIENVCTTLGMVAGSNIIR